jgi:hypothetical protein
VSFSFHGSHWRSRAGTLITHGPVFGEHFTSANSQNYSDSTETGSPHAKPEPPKKTEKS